MLFALVSCDKGYEEVKIENSNIDDSRPQKVMGDNEYDVLGWGCDATGKYLNSKHQLIDVEKMKLNEPNLIITRHPERSYMQIYSGETADSMLRQFENKFSLTLPIPKLPFKGTITQDFKITNVTTNKFSYAWASITKLIKHHEIRQFTPIETYKKYLDPTFVRDLEILSPQQIIMDYGTHFYTNIYTGGRFTMVYRARLNTTSKKGEVAYGVKIAAQDATNNQANSFGLDNSSNVTVINQSSLFQQVGYYETIGGYGTVTGIWTKSGDYSKLDFNTWLLTLKPENPRALQLVEVGDNSLIPIYELVDNPTKKAALKQAIENYINTNRLTVHKVVPLHGFKNKKTNNSFYSTNRYATHMAEPNEWEYRGVAAYVFPNQVPNSVPLYRFYRKKTRFMAPNYHNYYYTRDYQSGVINGYTYKGVECYVYASAIHGSTALGQYRNDSKQDHEYTTNSDGVSGYRHDGPAAFVYHGDWYDKLDEK